jgi:RNA polymerase sigma factor (sigma-70 family)
LNDPVSDSLESIVVERVRPLVARIVGRYRPRVIDAGEAEDLMAAIDVRVVRRLQQPPPIESLDDYVATIAYNAVHDFMRNRHPERARLKNRLHYLFAKEPDLALWSSAAGPLCGLETWRGRPPIEFREAVAGTNEREVVRAILRRAGAPLLFDDVVTIVADALHLADAITVAPSDDYAVDTSTPESDLILRQEVAMLWQGVQQLPPNQRIALLLNLRDASGTNALGLIVLAGIATIDELAGALGLTVERLSEMWSDLPLDDQSIASMLGLSRQQVVNLRKSARERLARQRARSNRWR